MNAGALGRLLRPLSLRIRGVVARAVVRIVNDSLKCQGLQVQVLAGETRTLERFQEYGFSSVPLDGAEAVIVFVGADRGHGIAVATEDRRHRPTGLAPGETVLYTAEGDKIHMRNGHVIEVQTGTLRVLGNIQATGDVADGVRSMAEERVIFAQHVHGGVEPGSGISGPPTNVPPSGAVADFDFALQAVEIPPPLLTGNARALGLLRIRGADNIETASVWISTDDVDYVQIAADSPHVTGGTLLEELPNDSADIEDGPIIQAQGPDFEELLLRLRPSGWELGRQLLVVGNEWMFLRDAEDLGGGTWRLKGIKRGRFRTPVEFHSPGAIAFVVDPNRLAPYYDPLVRDGQQVYVKSQPRTRDAAVELGAVAPASTTFGAAGPHDAQLVFYETPAGTIDGVNDTFELSAEPGPSVALLLFKNGLFMSPPEDFTLTGSTIVFAAGQIPKPGQPLRAALYQTG